MITKYRYTKNANYAIYDKFDNYIRGFDSFLEVADFLSLKPSSLSKNILNFKDKEEYNEDGEISQFLYQICNNRIAKDGTELKTGTKLFRFINKNTERDDENEESGRY